MKVATVEFEFDINQGNPVVAYLKRRGAAEAIASTLAGDG